MVKGKEKQLHQKGRSIVRIINQIKTKEQREH